MLATLDRAQVFAERAELERAFTASSRTPVYRGESTGRRGRCVRCGAHFAHDRITWPPHPLREILCGACAE
eukprot:12996150-Heterocapsa_arctica.AAC.1